MMAVRPHEALMISVVLALLADMSIAAEQSNSQRTLAPGAMSRVEVVDERYQAFNVEMVEITGGQFWKPYAAGSSYVDGERGRQPTGPAEMGRTLYEFRPPKDLSNRRLRTLAAALGPTYVRVSGT
jgi:heparanase 1